MVFSYEALIEKAFHHQIAIKQIGEQGCQHSDLSFVIGEPSF
jgi:hypothetical protein